MKRPAIYLMMLSLWLGLSGCSQDHGRLAGSGSVTTNGLTARVLKDGMPIQGIQVSIYLENYIPLTDSALPLGWKQITDHAGQFQFKNLAAGQYNLIASDSSGSVFATQFLITISTSLDSVLELAPLNLIPAGSLRVRLPEFVQDGKGFFYFPGTNIYKAMDTLAFKNGEIFFEHLPPATYFRLIYLASLASPERNILFHPISIKPEEVKISGPFSEWRARYKVSINTTETGSLLTEPLLGFPLLLRLNATHLNFKEARMNGSDVRITKADSLTVLPFEIERWDATAEQADIWVRLDTLQANDSSNYFCLFAGNDKVAAHDPGNAVFDTTHGFLGVWHLSDIPAGGHGVIRDQTANGFHGNPGSGLTVDALTQGIIGQGLTFDGMDDFIELPSTRLFLSDSNLSLTLSAWIRPSAINLISDSIPNRVLSFKTDTAKISSLAWGINNNRKMAHYSRNADSVFQWNSAIIVDSSYLVTLVFQVGKFSGYINGELEFESTGWSLRGGGIPPVILGGHLSKDRLFRGLIDEVRIERIPRSMEWIKFCFMNQHPGSQVVKVAP